MLKPLGAGERIGFTIFSFSKWQPSPKLRELLVSREDSNLYLGFRRELTLLLHACVCTLFPPLGANDRLA